MKRFRNTSTLIDRRSIICGAAKALLGVSALSGLPQFAVAAATRGFVGDQKKGGTAKSVIYVYLDGGLSQIDSFDPKPGTETQGPVESLRTNADGILVTEHFPKLAQRMDKVCVIRSMNSTQGAHEQGTYYMRTSNFTNQTIKHPDMGAWASYYLGQGNSTLPANVKIGGSSSGYWGGFLDPKHAAIPIGDPAGGLQHSSLSSSISNEQFARRLSRIQAMNEGFASGLSSNETRAHVELFDEAVRLMKSKDLDAFDLNCEDVKNREKYGNNSLGQGCLLARRLVERGVRFVEVNDRGWDTHISNFARMEEKGPVLDQALAALLADLSERGLLADTLVVVATEFGRTPTIDLAKVGRDHYPQAFTCLLAGGGVRGGQAYGETDSQGREIVSNPVAVPNFNATIAYALGLPLEEKVNSPSGRPFTVANHGTPLIDVFT